MSSFPTQPSPGSLSLVFISISNLPFSKQSTFSSSHPTTGSCHLPLSGYLRFFFRVCDQDTKRLGTTLHKTRIPLFLPLIDLPLLSSPLNFFVVSFQGLESSPIACLISWSTLVSHRVEVLSSADHTTA